MQGWLGGEAAGLDYPTCLLVLKVRYQVPHPLRITVQVASRDDGYRTVVNEEVNRVPIFSACLCVCSRQVPGK
jgi:hypothetical protein